MIRKAILDLSRSKAAIKVVKILSLHKLGNYYLRHFPLKRTLSGSNIHYRARRLDSIALSVEIFEDQTVYPLDIIPKHVVTFVDLGCNVGYFTCWMAHHLKTNQLCGLMVDANDKVLEDAQWHVKENALKDVHVLYGLVGMGETASREFFVHVTNTLSSTTPYQTPAASTWTRKEVPCINIGKNWQSRFGNRRCDLLKVDIEGSEVEFFKSEFLFLELCDNIIVEWHKWKVSLNDVRSVLESQGFRFKTALLESDMTGTAVFARG